MASSQNAQYLRPTQSKATTFVDTIISGKDYVQQYISNIDPQKLLPVAAFAATLGLGTAVYYFGQSKSTNNENADKPASPSPNKHAVKKRTIRSRSVAFQDPINSSVRGRTAAETEGDDDNADEEATKENTGPLKDSNDNVTLALPQFLTHGNVLVLKQCPRGRKTPCIAPFPLKLETFLRVHKLKYELDFNGHEPRHYGSPWIRFNTEDITDSQNVLDFLIKQYDLKMEKGLTAEQRSMATAYTHLLENHLYWGIALWRWVYDGARSLKDIQLLPKKTQDLIPDVCKTVEQAAWFHGIGKMAPEEVKLAVLQDLRSLSEFLGNKDYFLNTAIPTELDCTAFGMLAQFMWNMQGPFHEAVVDQYRNLRDFCWRIRLAYWPDWEDCLNNTQFYSEEPYPTADSVNYPF